MPGAGNACIRVDMTDTGGSVRYREVALEVAVMACLTFPWLNPWAAGPSPAVLPWLVTLFCAAWLLGLTRGVSSFAGFGGRRYLADVARRCPDPVQSSPPHCFGRRHFLCLCRNRCSRNTRWPRHGTRRRRLVSSRCVVGAA